MAVILPRNIVQLLQVEWNDLLVQRHQFLLLHLIIWLVGDHGDF